jgi:probable rRNA maturation factor
MLVHGMLHLLGYDHGNEADALAMESLESRILGEKGVQNPYEDA